ncbi:MAG: RNA polymerase sigma factor SigM [Pseudonocardia sp.]
MSAPVRSDAELLAAHVVGDRSAFAELVERHSGRLWAVATRILHSRDEAADALQEALISAHQAAPRFRAEAAVSTWLHRIVVNACIDRIRHNQVRFTLPLFSDGPAEPRATQDQIEALPTRLAVHDALALLPDDQRLAVVLVDLEGYPVAEVAAIVNVAEGTVKSRCARGRARLAVLLGHLRETDSERVDT